MKNKFIFLFWICVQIACIGCTTSLTDNNPDPKSNPSPDERYGELFKQVQLSRLFEDSKTFADASPRYATDKIMHAYHASRDLADFNLKTFVSHHFILPEDIASDFKSDQSRSAEEHINILWDVLTRVPEKSTDGSLISLPHPYVVPGGRFREIYYWDSYFTMLGLQESGRWDLIENMVDNFSYLIDTIGFIPNGNRTYYQSRSQPPFYSLMVKLLAEGRGKGTLAKYRPQLEKEYAFWMDGAAKLTSASPSFRRVVLLPDGSILNRYWDDEATPRPESYIEDIELAKNSAHEPHTQYRHIRAAAESGWDFSSRWLKDGKSMTSIHTTDIIPIDLNALLYHLELVLAEAFIETGENALAAKYQQLAQERKRALLSYTWNAEEGFFRDYDFVGKSQTSHRSLAAMYPLYFKMVEQDQAEKVAQIIERDFLKPGGVTTSLVDTNQQWDAPNGWAPLQWISIQGLRNYHQNRLAELIRTRWIQLNIDVYKRTGKMMEKYNVHELGLEGGGGEYPVQDGFGWTNGVLLKLLNKENGNM